MLLYSWNVNGIRAAQKKGFLDWLQQSNADVVCLQEIKARPDQLDAGLANPQGYHAYWFPAQKPGYSGLAAFSRQKPVMVHDGWGIEAFDAEGRTQTLEFEKFVLVNAYFPNSQREHTRLDYKLDFCQHMQRYLDDWVKKGKEVVLCGDYNIAHQEIDLANPKTNVNNAGFLPQERAWMSQFLQAGYHDIFREQHSGNGHYTWWSNRKGVREKNIGWRLDYHCVSAGLKNLCGPAQHHPQVMGSDHCPVSLVLKELY